MYHNKILSLYQLRMDQDPDSRPDPWFSTAWPGSGSGETCLSLFLEKQQEERVHRSKAIVK